MLFLRVFHLSAAFCCISSQSRFWVLNKIFSAVFSDYSGVYGFSADFLYSVFEFFEKLYEPIRSVQIKPNETNYGYILVSFLFGVKKYCPSHS